MDIESELRKLARVYQAPSSVREVFIHKAPHVLSGVTAAGKNVLERYLIDHGPFEKVITHTTRRPRTGEENGKDYWFVSSEEMRQLAQKKTFIEMELIHGYIYGISTAAVQEISQTENQPIINIDVNGAVKLSKILPGVRPLFLIPPSFDVWMQRLGGRARISDGERERRMHSAHLELETVLRNPAFIILVNDDVAHTGVDVIRGISTSDASQRPQRQSAQELLDYIKTQ